MRDARFSPAQLLSLARAGAAGLPQQAALAEASVQLEQARAQPPEPAARRNSELRPARLPSHPLGAALTRAHVARSRRRVTTTTLSDVIGTIETALFPAQARSPAAHSRASRPVRASRPRTTACGATARICAALSHHAARSSARCPDATSGPWLGALGLPVPPCARRLDLGRGALSRVRRPRLHAKTASACGRAPRNGHLIVG